MRAAKAIQLAKKYKTDKLSSVLVGGCFDILHYGHVIFLEKAKKKGDVLMVMLESDVSVKKLKGEARPLNMQDHRAKMLVSLRTVDVVIKLPEVKNNSEYNDLVCALKPDIIAITENDKIKEIKRKQAKAIGAKLYVVTKLIPDKSTTWLQERIERE